MKKTTKIILAVALAMVVLGAGLSTISYAISGGQLGVVWNSPGGLGTGRTEQGSLDTGAFSSINVTSDLGAVRLIPSDHYGVEYFYRSDLAKLNMSVENGQLEVGHVLLRRLISNSLGWFGSQNIPDDIRIDIHVPADAVLSGVSIHSSLGNVSARNLTVSGELRLTSDLGELRLEQVSAGRVTLKGDLGSAICTGLSTDYLDLSLAAGSLEATSCRIAGGRIDIDMGSANLSGDLSGDLDISCAMGSIDLRTTRPRSDFSLETATSMGKARVDGEPLHSGHSGTSDAPYKINARCDMGSIDLRFGR